MKKHTITVATVAFLLALAILAMFLMLLKPFDGQRDYSGVIYSIKEDESGNYVLNMKMLDSDELGIKLKVDKNTKIYDPDGNRIDSEKLNTGMQILVDFPLLKSNKTEGDCYVARKIDVFKP